MTETIPTRASGATTVTDEAAESVRRRLVGSWTTVLDNDGTAAPGLCLFTADGGVTAMQVTTSNAGLGTWRATGPDSFEYGFHILAAGEEKQHVGTAHIRVQGRFVSDDAWEGTGGAEFRDPAGDLLRGHTGNRVDAVRYGVED